MFGTGIFPFLSDCCFEINGLLVALGRGGGGGGGFYCCCFFGLSSNASSDLEIARLTSLSLSHS